MLQMRPTCEHCARLLPPDSTQAMICSYECTFCTTCVSDVLDNVCPNCGGGFKRRPTRPKKAWCDGVSCDHQPPTDQLVSKPVDAEAHERFAAAIRDIAPELR